MIERVLIPNDHEGSFECDICATRGCMVIVQHDSTPPVDTTKLRQGLLVWMCRECVAKSPDVLAELQKPEFVLAMLQVRRK